ncbi:unnamed protein product [Aphanomyces euteiches]|nr:hypothetical protein Ae201684P_002391 [Aphanomyces euteiches]KAH9145762.1 hypothetical protein AeRB84_010347 [Aphanomyces euteiches]
MVGFGRKKGKSLLGDSAGKIDGSSLLDGNGDPTMATLYDNNGDKKVKRVVDNPEDEDPDAAAKKPSRSWFRLGRRK